MIQNMPVPSGTVPSNTEYSTKLIKKKSMSNTFILKLYIVTSSSASEMALGNLKQLISRESGIVFQLEVIDVRQNPRLAEEDKVLAIPTLIRIQPQPVRKIIGDLSDIENVLLGLNLLPQKN